MGQLDALLQGIASAAGVESLLIIFIGVVVGILVGAIPGLGPTVGMAVALPVIIRFSPELSIWLLMAIVVGAAFGNSLTAIILGIPGTPSALLSTIESEPFRRNRTELKAATVALLSSVVAQLVAVVAFILFVLPLADFALRFLFPELFALTLFALLTVIGLSRASPAKGTAAAAFGFALGLVGPDPITSQIRFGFGIPELYTGMPIVAALIGLLAFREVFNAASRSEFFGNTEEGLGLRWPRWSWIADFRSQLGSTGVGTGVGTIIGALPGAGPAVATFVTYGVLQVNKRVRATLGKGSLKAIAGIDAAQNAASTTALVPTLALGVPGSAPMVIVMALLSARGIFPGPSIVRSQPELLHAVFGGLLMAVPFLLVAGFLILGPAVYISRISHPGIVSGAIVLMIVGVYSMRWSLTDVWIALGVGIVGYLMSERGYPIAPAALGLILAPIMETNLRRGLVMTDDLIEFVTRPVTAVLLLLGLGFLFVSRTNLERRTTTPAKAED